MKSWFKKFRKFLSKTTLRSRKPIDVIDISNEENAPWWGTFLVSPEQSRFFKVGNIILCIDHYNHEWHIVHYKEENSEKYHSKSLGAKTTNGEISLNPILPDRTIIVPLERPVFLPTRSEMTLYCSSPLWIEVEMSVPGVTLDEIPTLSLSDTWFGSHIHHGELCYASNMPCSTRSDELPKNTSHIHSPIIVSNRSKEPVLLKELRVPLCYLSVYHDPQYQLWTEQLRIHFEDLKHFQTTILKGPPKHLKNLTLVSTPRFKVKSGFKELFSTSSPSD